MSEKLAKLQGELEDLGEYIETNKADFYQPYDKQKAFHKAGKTYRERLFMAGNQLGKTLAMGNEMSYHATGRYPNDWKGKKYYGPTTWWVGSISSEFARDNAQKMLFGPPGQYGTGTIPRDCIPDNGIKMARGVADAIDTAHISHKKGGKTIIQFKSYEKGREKWQGATLTGGIWLDEECPIEIYSEAMARTQVHKAMMAMTATPLLGMSAVVERFLQKNQEKGASRWFTQMTFDEVGHIDEKDKAQWAAGYPEHEREARLKGQPMLGSGRIYPVAESVIVCDAIKVVSHWKQIVGLDLGYGGEHPTAAVWLAYDEENDTIYVTDVYRKKEPQIALHASAIRRHQKWIPVAWPKDAEQMRGGDTMTIRQIYKEEGCKMVTEYAQYPDKRGNGVAAGIEDILLRMQTERFKVFSHLTEWFEEFRTYHRKEGKINKYKDDLLDATRYGIMMLRYAKARENLPQAKERYKLDEQRAGVSWLSG